MSAPFIDTASCQQNFHWFLYTSTGVKAFHSDDHECETSEFRLPLRRDEIEVVEGERCAECGNTPESGACHFCKMD